MKKIEIFIVVLLTCGVLLGMFPKILVDPFYYFAADVSELYFPWWVYLNQSVRTQTYPPIRNPYWFMGSMPFASLENGSFYPPYILAQLFYWQISAYSSYSFIGMAASAVLGLF